MQLTPEEAQKQMEIANDCVGRDCPPPQKRKLLPTHEEDWRRVDILLHNLPQSTWDRARNKADDEQISLSVWVTKLVKRELGEL